MVLKSQVSQKLMWGKNNEMALQAKALAAKPDCRVPVSSTDGEKQTAESKKETSSA